MGDSSQLPTYEAALKYPERLNLLFSPFRAKALNPEHYEEKLKFWTRVIEEYVTNFGKLSFSIVDLQTAFKLADGRRPACLVEVINHLLREKVIVPRDEWVNSLNSQSTWVSWSIGSVKWAFTKALSYAPVAVTYAKREIDPETQFIHLLQVQHHEEKIQSMGSLQNTVMGLDEWKKEVAPVVPEDMDLMMEHLKASGKLITDHISHVEVVKLAYPKLSRKSEITSAEKSQYDIARTIQILEDDLIRLVEKQEQYENLARQALKAGKRSTAKHHLRTKKLAEKRAAKLNEVLDNLSSISNQIEDSASDALVVSAYEAGKKALAKQLKDNNLNTNRVTEAMLDLQEVLEDYDEVSSSISQPVMAEDVTEMEEELAMLMEEEKHGTSKTVNMRDPTEEALSQLDDIDMDELEELPIKTKNTRRTLTSETP